MSRQLGKEDMINSQSAIKRYIDYRDGNCYRHKAKVLISANGTNRFSGILYIYAAIDSAKSFVLVERNEEYARDFYSEYTSEHQSFSVIRGTLLIQATDIWGNAITIDISEA